MIVIICCFEYLPIVLVSFYIIIIYIGIGNTCSHKYEHQPGNVICNPEVTLPLNLTCQVSGNTNFKIQWHHSNSSSRPTKHSSTSIESVLPENATGIKTEKPNRSNSGEVSGTYCLTSVLTLMDYDQAVAGYYWCTVNVNDSTLPNPSKVLYVSTCPLNSDTWPKSCNSSIPLHLLNLQQLTSALILSLALLLQSYALKSKTPPLKNQQRAV